MTTAVQLAANRCNAQLSTGPRSVEGKRRSSLNATRHGFLGRLLLGLEFGPFADDPAELQSFVSSVIEELGPASVLEQAEANNIAGLLVRRARLVELEALALQHTSLKPLRRSSAELVPVMTEGERQLAGATALSSELLDRLPRYEGHLNRELDRGLARYRRLQSERLEKDQAPTDAVALLPNKKSGS